MGMGSRFRINLNRRKLFNWERTTKIKVVVGSLCIFLVIFMLNFLVNTVNFNTTKIIPIADGSINEEIRASLNNVEADIYLDKAKNDIEEISSLASIDENVDIYEKIDIAQNTNIEEENEQDLKNDNKIPEELISESKEKDELKIEEKNDEKNDKQVKTYVDKTVKKDNVDFTVVGEIMMGGIVTSNLNFEYVNAFRDITRYTRDADFTYGTLPTNITSLEKFQNLDNKYLVTKDIKNAFVSMGIDALSIATPHIADYDKTFFGTTIDNLKLSKIYMAGINNSTLFVDVAGKKIAIISALSSYIGNKMTYNEFGVNLYDEQTMQKDISEAKDKADFVIVDVSWGREDKFGVSTLMTDIAYKAIDNGANLVVGTNALGIYPMYEYKGVPIIYSVGRLITDSDLTLAERSYIWKFNINKENRVDRIDMIPVLTFNNTYTKEFKTIDSEMNDAYNALINEWNIENGLNSNINSDGTITVIF